jgi:hypothetical protein
VIVRPFDDGTCAVVDVKLTDHWYPFPIEIIDPEVLPATEGAALSLEQLLERSAAYAADPDGVGMGGGRRSRGPKSKDDNAQNLTSMADVAPQLESICELAIALETSLVGAPTPEAMHARFRAYFEPTLRALSQCDPPEQLRSRMFALLDVQRAADRVRRSVPARDRARRSILDEICMECASFPTRLEKSLGPGDRAWIVGLRRRFEAA